MVKEMAIGKPIIKMVNYVIKRCISINMKSINQLNSEGKKEGYWETYYDNGKLQDSGNWISVTEKGFSKRYKHDGQLYFGIDSIKDGYWERYHYNGQLHHKGNFVNGKVNGLWEYYRTDGVLFYRCHYSNGSKEGYCEEYHTNGQLFSRGHCINDNRYGIWEFYHSNNQLYSKELYMN